MSVSDEVEVTIADALLPVFAAERGAYRYRLLYGGRGSGKSFSAAKMAAIWGTIEPIRVLCTREFQASIRESFHAELRNAIQSEPWLEAQYDIGVEYIRGKNGTEFFFRGLRNNIGSIKSMAQIDLTIVEEAEDIPEDSWQALLATIFRTQKSELWAIWNPRTKGSPVDKRFIENIPPNAISAQVNYYDNPFFPAGLEELRQHEQATLDPNVYANIWEGDYLTRSEAIIFSGRYVQQEFEPDPNHWDGPYYGADFGFAKDPSAMVKCWINGDHLYIEKEYCKVGVDIDKLGGEFLKAMPEAAKATVRADSARPDLISYLKRPTSQSGGSGQLLNMVGAEKGKGSVLDGIEFIKSHKIIVHPRCQSILKEFRNYSYKVDRLSGDILPDIVDDWNHCIAEGQRVHTDRGMVAIESVTTDDLVMTRGGYQKVLFSGVTDVNRKVLRIKSTLGTLDCTPDHRIWTSRGFVRADTLRYGDELLGDEYCQKLLFGTEKNTDDTQGLNPTPTDHTSDGRAIKDQSIFTEKFGNCTKELSLKDSTFITSMRIRAITAFQTLTAYLLRTTSHCMRLGEVEGRKCLLTLSGSGHSLRRGTQAKKAWRFTEGLERLLTKTLCRSKKIAPIARSHSFPGRLGTRIGSAATHVSQHGDEHLVSMMKKESANIADLSSSLTNTERHKPVVGHVLTVTDSGVSERVYDLTVENNHEFFVEGILVHNCLDSLRYSLEPVMKRNRFNWNAV